MARRRREAGFSATGGLPELGQGSASGGEKTRPKIADLSSEVRCGETKEETFFEPNSTHY